MVSSLSVVSVFKNIELLLLLLLLLSLLLQLNIHQYLFIIIRSPLGLAPTEDSESANTNESNLKTKDVFYTPWMRVLNGGRINRDNSTVQIRGLFAYTRYEFRIVASVPLPNHFVRSLPSLPSKFDRT